MKVSHETPLSMLEASREFNDYDYALVHAFAENPVYYEFYKESLRNGRTVILDNSLFELETMFDSKEFAEYVTILGNINSKNFYYIVPDALEEKDETINSFKNWKEDFSTVPGNSIGVVQGKNLDEIIECYEYMCENADKVAISFDYSYYEELFPNASNKYEAWMLGRQWLMTYLADNGYLDRKPIHLLGTGLAREFKMYTTDKFKCIESVDTSNPIIMGMKSHRYDNETGLDTKESIKLVELFDATLTEEQLDNVYHNIKIFREFCQPTHQ